MFERFDDDARRAVVLAQEQARLLGHRSIGTEHLLLGVLSQHGAVADAVAQRGITLEAVRHEVEEIVGPSSGSPSGYIPFTPRAKEVLELSLREALTLGHRSIGPPHILLGLLREGQGVACQALTALGVDLRELRVVADEVAGGAGRKLPEPPPDLRLADVRAALEAVEAHLGEETRLAYLGARLDGSVQVFVHRPGSDEFEGITVVDRGDGWQVEQP